MALTYADTRGVIGWAQNGIGCDTCGRPMPIMGRPGDGTPVAYFGGRVCTGHATL